MRIGKPPKDDKNFLPTTKLSTIIGTLEKWLSYQNKEERGCLALSFEELVGDHKIEGVS